MSKIMSFLLLNILSTDCTLAVFFGVSINDLNVTRYETLMIKIYLVFFIYRLQISRLDKYATIMRYTLFRQLVTVAGLVVVATFARAGTQLITLPLFSVFVPRKN